MPGLRGPVFWKELQTFMETWVAPVRLSNLALRSHQVEIKKGIESFFTGSEERSFVVAPTGSGKTRCIIEAIDDSMTCFEKSVTVVASPRIRLSAQIKKEIYDGRVGAICSFYSEQDELVLKEDDSINNKTRYFDESVKDFVRGKLQSVIVTTYHSLTNKDRLAKYINELKVELGLKVIIICDECHNVVKNETFAKLTTVTKDVIDFDKLLGFTATPIRTQYIPAGGMNHSERWGSRLMRIKYREMFLHPLETYCKTIQYLSSLTYL